MEKRNIEMESGLLVKHIKNNKPDFVRWKDAGLREASIDEEGFFIKVDGTIADGKRMEQLYLYLNIHNVTDVISGWKKAIRENGSELANFLLDEALYGEE